MANFNVGEVVYRKAYEGREAYLILGIRLRPHKKYMLYNLTVDRLLQDESVPTYERAMIVDHNHLLVTSKEKDIWGKIDDTPIAE
jgi:hypothetical protein